MKTESCDGETYPSQETENYVREIDRRRGEIMKRMETNAITKEIERRLVRIMEKVGLLYTGFL